MPPLKQESELRIILDTETRKKALELGPLESIFPCSTSKILDFMVTFSDWDYSITDIAKNSGLSFKTGFDEVKKLEMQEVLINSRSVGKALMYELNKESSQTQLIIKLALDIAKKRAIKESVSVKTKRRR